MYCIQNENVLYLKQERKRIVFRLQPHVIQKTNVKCKCTLFRLKNALYLERERKVTIAKPFMYLVNMRFPDEK